MKQMTVHTIASLKARSSEVGNCWEWDGGTQSNNPVVYDGGKIRTVRRVMLRLAGKEIPTGQYATTKCGNARCINPAHITTSSAREIALAAADRGAYRSIKRRAQIAFVMRSKHAKINASIAREILMSDDKTQEIAARYGVGKTLVSRIKRGVAWVDYSSPWSGLGARRE